MHELMVEDDSKGKASNRKALEKDLDLAIVVLVRGTKSSRLSSERRGRRDESDDGMSQRSEVEWRHGDI